MTTSNFDENSDRQKESEWVELRRSLEDLDLPDSVLPKYTKDPSSRALVSWARFQKRIGDPIGVGANTPAAERRLPKDSWISKYATHFLTSAITVCFVGLAVSNGWFGIDFDNNSNVIATSSASAIYSTQNGNQAVVNLPDGSSIILNVASRLEVEPGFGETNRSVRLIGEAFFKVDQSKNLPFVVNSGDVATRVLGTEFSVRAYDQSDISVAVQSGRVSVDTSVVDANEIVFIRGNQLSKVTNVNVADHIAFSQGKLVITNKALRDAIADINRWYDIEIVLESPSMGNELIDAVLTQGSLSNLVVILESVFGARVHVEGRKVIIR